jgi:hypothetical protein
MIRLLALAVELLGAGMIKVTAGQPQPCRKEPTFYTAFSWKTQSQCIINFSVLARPILPGNCP